MKVLVVDDEPDIIATLVLCWSHEDDVELASAMDGPAALQQIEDEVPDVVLTDFRMPHMDGIELMTIIKKNHPDMRVFMMSAFPDLSLKQRAKEVGSDGFLSKPFDPFELLDHLRGEESPSDGGKGGRGLAAWLAAAVGSVLGQFGWVGGLSARTS